MNVQLRESVDFAAESDWALSAVDLNSIKQDAPKRELLAGTIVDFLFSTFRKFEEAGFADFSDEWHSYDWLRDREITVDTPDQQVTGLAVGVDEDGALLVDARNGRMRVISGSIVMVGERRSS